MTIAVVYTSVLGSTKMYAHWLSQELHADIFTFSQINDGTLDPYDIVIVSSGTYAAGMPLVDFLITHWNTLQHKKIVVVAVGMLLPNDPQSIASYNRLPEYIRNEITYFKLPGKLVAAGPAGKPSIEKLKPVIKHVTSLA